MLSAFANLTKNKEIISKVERISKRTSTQLELNETIEEIPDVPSENDKPKKKEKKSGMKEPEP